MAVRGRSMSVVRRSYEEPPLSPREWVKLGFGLSESRPIHAGCVTADPAAGPDYDMHYGVELGVVLRGKMRRYWRGWQADVEPGQVWLCGMWERHGWEALTSSCRHLVLVLLPRWLLHSRFKEAPDLDWMAPFTAPPRRRPQANAEQRREILAITQRFEANLSPGGASRPAFLELLTLELLLVLLKDWRPGTRRRLPDLDLYLDIVNRAVEMALESRQRLTTGQVAHVCGLSTRAFAGAFRELMGISFAEFALRSRLAQAVAQLVNTADSVSSVAAQWGFSHISHFQRAFKQHYGVSPGAYRRKRG